MRHFVDRGQRHNKAAGGHHQDAPGQRAPELVVQVTDTGDIDEIGHVITCERKTHAPVPRGGGP